jgi:signal transduction histidine kinase/CheY-like chemotaxis protein
MTIGRQFYLLVSLPSLLAIGVVVALTYQFADLSSQGARLIANIERTEGLNQQLASGNDIQGRQLRQQLERLDTSFPDSSKSLNYSLGEKYAEYLKLNIGEEERLTVEHIRALQSEMSVRSMHIYELLKTGRQAEANLRLHDLHGIETRTWGEFESLNGLQLRKLGTVLGHLNRSATDSLVVVCALVATLGFVAAGVVLMFRRRVLEPLHAVLLASERMRAGDFAARVSVGRADEMGQLTQGFNFMAESLAEGHDSLEKNVRERTKQLENAQERLLESEKMSAVGQLVSGVAHELNNPLAAIVGLAELAADECSSATCHVRATSMLGDIQSQAERCRRIVLNLLQFARKQAPHLEAVAINALIDQVLKLREYELQTKNIRIVREFDPANPILSADPDKIQQVVLNLLNNAHDALRETGRPGTIWVRTSLRPPNVVLEFLDDGPGFPDPGRAFDPFYTTKEVGSGTGLGLSVCYGIVREHGGEITAANGEKGAHVTVMLPIGQVPKEQGPARAAPQPTDLPRPSRNLHALVVDDEQLLQRLQVSFLSKMDIRATAVSTGEEAIRFLQDHRADVVISDVRMPGSVDGVGLYEWVRANRPELAERFVFVSGDLVGLNLSEFFQRTQVPSIAKPFRFDGYRNVVGHVLSSGDAQP